MIRIILYRIPKLGSTIEPVWQRGLLHMFTADGCAIVEDLATGDLRLIQVQPDRLKFEEGTIQWLAAQQAAQQRPGTSPK